MRIKDVLKDDYRTIIREIPKTEIHLHIEGLASVDTIWSLKEKHNITLPGIKSKTDISKRFKVKNLDDFIDLFLNVIQNCFRGEDDLDFLIQDTRDYLKRNNIFYAEIFFAPSKFVMNGFSFADMMTHLDNGAQLIQKEDNRKVKFLIDVSRGFGPENAMNNLNLTLENRKPSIIGIGLGGAESKGPAGDYKKVFKKARAHGLKVLAHAGEDVGPESIWSALKDLKVSRIGHGISAKFDPKLEQYLAKKQIPLEICPMSNIFTGKYATSYKDHPIRHFYDRGLYVTVNSDDPTIFGAELDDEYYNLLTNNIFSLEEIFLLMKNNLYATFLSDKEKNNHWKQMKQIMNKCFT